MIKRSFNAFIDHDCIGPAISGCRPGVAAALDATEAASRRAVLPTTLEFETDGSP
jgi:hypothetical protein